MVVINKKEIKNNVIKQTSLPRWAWWLPPFLLVLVGFMVYFSSLHYCFAFDDVINIQKRFAIRTETFWSLFFTSSRWIGYWLSSVYYSINVWVGRSAFDPFVFRVGSVLFHLITGILVYYLFLYLLEQQKEGSFLKKHSFFIAGLTSIFFILHPVQTQTVSYAIQAQLEGVSAFFVVSSTLCCILMIYVRTALKKIIATILLFVLLFFSTGSKEIAIVSPILLALVDWFFIARGEFPSFKRRCLYIYLPALVLVVSCYMYLLDPSFFGEIVMFKREISNNWGNVLTENPREKIVPLTYLISQFKVIIHYIYIFFWPFSISVDYDWKVPGSFWDFSCIFYLSLLLILLAVVFWRLRRNKTDPISFGIIWFFLAVLPRSSFIPSSELLADYKTYLASIGIFFVFSLWIVYGSRLCFTIMEKTGDLSFLVQIVVLSICMLILAVGTYQRNQVWSSGEAFWENVIKNAPGRARAYNNYAVCLAENGKLYESIPFFKKAIKLDDFYADPANNLAVIYQRLGNAEEAIPILKASLRINPRIAEGYNNIAACLIMQKKYDEAAEYLQQALALRSHYGKAWFNLGRIRIAQGNMWDAYEKFKTCCTKADFDVEVGFAHYGRACMQLGKYDEAEGAFKKALVCNSQSAFALQELALCYKQQGRIQAARELLTSFIANNPRHDQLQGLKLVLNNL